MFLCCNPSEIERDWTTRAPWSQQPATSPPFPYDISYIVQYALCAFSPVLFSPMVLGDDKWEKCSLSTKVIGSLHEPGMMRVLTKTVCGAMRLHSDYYGLCPSSIKARQANFIYIAHFMHMCNSMCFTYTLTGKTIKS